MKSTLTYFGIIAPEREPIEYHERAPLVVPKSMALPPPAAQHASSRNQAWPVDPDVARKAKEKAEAAQPVRSGGADPDNARASIWTMLGGRSSSAPIQPAGPDPNKLPESGYIPNGVLRAQGQAFAAQNPETGDVIAPGSEPKRKFLTDPPTGYRRPSDKAAFKKQYGAPQQKDDKVRGLDFVREQAERQKGSYEPKEE